LFINIFPSKDTSVLILEGIEQKTDFDTALSLGVTIGQAYLFRKPTPLIPAAK
jgi:EAL domain-containing protein (putative c-di-GMP-specific phosphodiesterase class I)